jgi:hypothetical protein
MKYRHEEMMGTVFLTAFITNKCQKVIDLQVFRLWYISCLTFTVDNN